MPTTRSLVERELFIRSFMAHNPGRRVIERLGALMQDVQFAAGQALYRRGEAAEHLFFIVTGEVELSSPDETPWTLGARTMVGIIDAALRRPHARTATALCETRVLVLRFDEYYEVLEENFEDALNMLTTVVRRGYELLTEVAPDAPWAVELHDERLESVPGSSFGVVECTLALRAARPFNRAPIQALTSLAQAGELRNFEPGALVIPQGDPGHSLWFLLQGDVWLEGAAARVRCGPPRLLGGLFALGYERWPCRVVAAEPLVCLVLDRGELFDVMEDHAGLMRSLFSNVAEDRERILLRRHGRPRPVFE